jgi:probable HAF family extracellular repeat protein
VIVGDGNTNTVSSGLVAPGPSGPSAAPVATTHAFRWAAGTITDIGTLGGNGSSAGLVSADGSVVVGLSQVTGNLSTQAFRWTSAGGMINLNTRTDAASLSSSSPAAMNSTGTVIVGQIGGRIRGFATLTAQPDSVSVISGSAFRWTKTSGMQTVEEWLTASGVTVAPTFQTQTATGVSEDGTVVVGITQSGDSYLARGSGLITVSDLQKGMTSTANSLSLATDAGWTMLNGAHGHPLSRRAPDSKSTAWVAGDLGEDNHASRDGNVAVGEFGVGHNYGKFQANLALGKTVGTQRTPVAGKTDLDGTYLIADLLTQLPGRPVWVTFTGFYQLSSLDIRRGYLNAGTPDASSASFDAHTVGAALRADWENAASFAGFDLTPYIKGTVAQTRTPTFTETGGGFPSTIAGRKDLAT